MMTISYRNRLIRLPQNRVWRTYPGGAVLDRLASKESPEDTHFPEDWIGSTTQAVNPGREDIAEGVSLALVEGEKGVQPAQLSFPALIASDPAYFLGRKHVAAFGKKPMLLVKFLDSAVRLHFQCHPTAAFARAHLGSNSGKAEAYYILQARPAIAEPYVYIGFQRPPERDQLKNWIETQDIASIEGCFDKIPVKAGDCLFIPGGFPHAIGEGIFMTEIMEPSDLAVRFEFEKAGYVLPESARFMNRGLDFCLDVFDYRECAASDVREHYMFQPVERERLNETSATYQLIGSETTDRFAVHKAVISGNVELRTDSFYIGIVTKGSCTVDTGGVATQLGLYDKFFCPAGLESLRISSDAGVEILQCLPPDPSLADS